jgi:hypothetical protein
MGNGSRRTPEGPPGTWSPQGRAAGSDRISSVGRRCAGVVDRHPGTEGGGDRGRPLEGQPGEVAPSKTGFKIDQSDPDFNTSFQGQNPGEPLEIA